MSGTPLLHIDGLRVAYGQHEVVSDVGLDIERGQTFALVGESGCGKTTVALALMRYLPPSGRVVSGRIELDGRDVLGLEPGALRAVRGGRVAMVYQNPSSALNPSMRVGEQVAEAFGAAPVARAQALAMLRQVRLQQPEQIYARYPHQLSGGQQQRIVIAMALASRPQLLVLDEPTTGLDATVEASVLELIADLQRELGTAILFITHNLGIVGRMAERVGVLYAGQIVEQGVTNEVFARPAHPYTRGLLACVPRGSARHGSKPLRPIPGKPPGRGARPAGCAFAPRCAFARAVCFTAEPPLVGLADERLSRCFFIGDVLAADATAPAPSRLEPRRIDPGAPVLAVDGARKVFRAAGARTVALDGIDLELAAGETLGLVGESGSGKSTLARAIAGLEALDAGQVRFAGQPVDQAVTHRARSVLERLQMVFQDPESTLNPAHTVRTILERSLRRLTRLSAAQRTQRLGQLLDAVHLEAAVLEAHPAELSGGQKQRVAIARAFASAPSVVLCDEPVSALDVSVQAAILNLLDDLQRERGAAYLFISHDIGVVHYLADRVAVMYGGKIVEIGPVEAVFAPPHHPYTALLLAAAASRPVGDDAAPAAGTFARGGCVFADRCPRRIAGTCETQPPPWQISPAGDRIRCHIPLDDL